VTGRFEDLELIGRLLRGETITAPIVEGAEIRFDLKVDQTAIGAIINTLKRQRNLTIVVDPAVANKLGTRVTFDVKQATLAELLEAALKPAGIAFQLKGTTLELMPQKP
jgi:type II secretory pathway component GspD/PulD (secretin)